MAAVPESAAKWTILVYMNAANDLAAFAQGDLDEMERVAQNPKVDRKSTRLNSSH